MDPCPFVRLIIESLALKLPLTATKSASHGIHPSSTPCFAKLKLKNFPTQTTILPLSPTSDNQSPPESAATATGFHLDAAALRRLSAKPVTLTVSVFTGRMGGHACGVTSSGKLMGSVQVSVDLSGTHSKPRVFQNGWMKLGENAASAMAKPVAMLHIVVRAELDPRFVFQFGGEPECSPVVFQIQGNIRQPVFSCKFSADRNNRSR